MAARTYVSSSEYDSTEQEITIANIGGRNYLQMGDLGTDEANLFESIIDGHVGFFLDDARVAIMRVAAPFDEDNGIQIVAAEGYDGIEELVLGNLYHVDFTQARPGRDGRPAEIEVQDTPTGIQVRGKSGAATDFDAWHQVRDGRDGMDGEDAPIHFYRGIAPFYRGTRGRFYRGITPFYRGLQPYYRGVKGKFYRGVSGQEDRKRPFDAVDVLNLFDGIPQQVADYFWLLIRDRIPDIPDPVMLRDAEQTFELVRARIQGLIEGYTLSFTRSEKNKLASTEIFSSTEKSKLLGIEANAKDDQTGSELLALLLALPEGTRIPYAWLDGRPTIPMDTLAWGGQWRTLTAYSDGTIVVDNNNVFLYLVDIPATNTTRPGDDLATNVEHLDIGSPEDITHAVNSGLTITFTRRSGASFNITITPTDIYNAVNAMTTEQKVGLRNIISAAAANHNHDGRYYTETETDTLLDGKSDTGHNHDGRYYTETESNSRFAQRNHTHPASGITEEQARTLFSLLGHNHDSRYYTETEVNTRLAGKSNTGHTHPAANLTATQVHNAILGFSQQQDYNVLGRLFGDALSYYIADTRRRNTASFNSYFERAIQTFSDAQNNRVRTEIGAFGNALKTSGNQGNPPSINSRLVNLNAVIYFPKNSNGQITKATVVRPTSGNYDWVRIEFNP